eukprot:1954044-Prymnesium_polylepis.1
MLPPPCTSSVCAAGAPSVQLGGGTAGAAAGTAANAACCLASCKARTARTRHARPPRCCVHASRVDGLGAVGGGRTSDRLAASRFSCFSFFSRLIISIISLSCEAEPGHTTWRRTRDA